MKILFLHNRFENLGIEMLSSFLKSHGHKTELVFDPQLFNDSYLNSPCLAKRFDYKEKILKDVEEIEPDIVAFSVITDNYQWALDLARSIKKKFSIPVVFGGVHCTSVPEEVISNDCVDFIIMGEGEYAILELVGALEKNKSYYEIKNLVSKKGGKVIKNEVRDLIENLDELPFPDKDLFCTATPFCKRIYSVMTSRGCPYSCTYCFNNVYRKLYSQKGEYLRRRSVDNVISELKIMQDRFNYSFVSILDDVFITDSKWLEEFSEKYKRIINVPFRCIGHINCIDENNIKMLKNANCEIIQIGIQTTCENTRRNIIHRYETNDAIRRAVKIIKENRIRFEVDHIIGFPYEAEKEQIEAAKFYNSIRPDIINCYWLKCFPKTDIIEHMLKDKKMSQEDIEKIEQGLTPSYILGGNVKNIKDMQKFFSLFNMIPLLSKKVVDIIIQYKIYYLANFGTKFMVFLRIIKGLFWRDLRLIEFSSFYRYYMIKRIR